MGGLVTLTIFESTAPQVVKGSLLKSADVKSTLLKELKAMGILGAVGGLTAPAAIGATLGAPVGFMTAADALPDSIIDSVGAHMAGGAAAGYAAPVGAGLAAALMYKLKLLGNADKGYRISRGLAGMSGGAAAAGIPAWHGVSSLFKDHYRDSGKTEGSRFRDAWFTKEEEEAEAEGLEKKSSKLEALVRMAGKLGLTKTDNAFRVATKGLADNLVWGPTAGLGGLAGLGFGMANAPEGESLKGGLSTGAGLAAAVLGGVGGRRWLQHLASKKGLRLNLNQNMQRMVGYGGGGTLAGMGTSKGVQELSDLIGI